jgi:nitrite reductase (NO-forming)
VLPLETRRGAWLPVHLALAGGAATAIAAVMPFFSSAFAAVPPADPRLRAASVVAVAGGAALVAAGVAIGPTGLAVLGGIAFVVGVAAVGLATLLPVRAGLGPGRGLVTRGYAVALVDVGLGGLLGTLFLAGWAPLQVAWAGGRPAHAWLNLFGFLSLVVATTLLHFFPTVVGARIANRPSARVTVYGLAAGAPAVALGYLAGSDAVVRIGALGVLAGAGGLTAYAVATWRMRARWTSDPGWHRFAMLGLAGAIAWFDIGVVVAAGRALAFGASPVAWSTALVAAPLAAGWAATAVIASATHLLPAVGPGGPLDHARQRALLGRGASLRLLLLAMGTALLAFGLAFELGDATVAGAVLFAAGLVGTAVLLVAAAAVGVRGRRSV